MSTTSPSTALLELAAYLASSARLSLDEPPVYGSFRLAEGLSRLVAAAQALGVEVDAAVLEARDSVEANKLLMIEQHEAFRDWLDGLAASLAAELARRNLDTT